MTRQRILLTVIVATLVLSLGSTVRAGSIVISSHPTARVILSRPGGLGHGIGPRIWHPPYHKPVVVESWRERFLRLGSPHYRTVVVHHPPVRHVPIAPAPVRTVASPPVVAAGTITVWITNSNGSRTSVRMTRNGSGYLGPRGEWYAGIPTNEQLRVVYGF